MNSGTSPLLALFPSYHICPFISAIYTERQGAQQGHGYEDTSGQALGCALFEPVVTRIGYKWVMVLVIILQIVGVVGTSLLCSRYYLQLWRCLSLVCDACGTSYGTGRANSTDIQSR
jgi:hypothetical protein